MKRYCPKCRTQAFDVSSLFCYKCGTSLTMNPPKIMNNHFPGCETKIVNQRSTLIRVPVQQIKPMEICAKCGTTVMDSYSIYCKKCGAHFREPDREVEEPGKMTSMRMHPILETRIKNPITALNPITAEERIIPPQKTSVPISVNKIFANLKFEVRGSAVLLTGIAVLVFLGLYLSVWGIPGISNFNSGNNLQSQHDLPVTQDLSSMAFTIDDLSSGWIIRSSSGTLNQYSADFVRSSASDYGVLTLDMRRYSTIDNARREYYSQIARSPNVKTEAVNLGSEGFGYIYSDKAVIIFRKGNVIIKIEEDRTDYLIHPTLENAKDYASIVADRIH
jgi:Double zinc ribbon